MATKLRVTMSGIMAFVPRTEDGKTVTMTVLLPDTREAAFACQGFSQQHWPDPHKPQVSYLVHSDGPTIQTWPLLGQELRFGASFEGTETEYVEPKGIPVLSKVLGTMAGGQVTPDAEAARVRPSCLEDDECLVGRLDLDLKLGEIAERDTPDAWLFDNGYEIGGVSHQLVWEIDVESEPVKLMFRVFGTEEWKERAVLGGVRSGCDVVIPVSISNYGARLLDSYLKDEEPSFRWLYRLLRTPVKSSICDRRIPRRKVALERPADLALAVEIDTYCPGGLFTPEGT